ncbi:MAG: VTT domain-containing protein [Dehalococcoidia bacterium]|nr:VTT domain-containing protein [Dehalococcoidia bacterium]
MTLDRGERQASRPFAYRVGWDKRTVNVREEETAAAVQKPARFAWRLEYTLLIGVGLLLSGCAIAFFYFSADISNLRTYGYAGLFLINLIGAASILLPSPAAVTVIGAGALLEDFLGVPVFVWVGLVAGLGEALGEFSGYAAGYGGRFIIESRPEYPRIRSWMERNGTLTIFMMSIVPNPLFDVAGLAAGAVRMPMARFFVAVLVGKTLKNGWMAALGGLGVSVIARLA